VTVPQFGQASRREAEADMLSDTAFAVRRKLSEILDAVKPKADAAADFDEALINIG
jgi:hypothetical protein